MHTCMSVFCSELPFEAFSVFYECVVQDDLCGGVCVCACMHVFCSEMLFEAFLVFFEE